MTPEQERALYDFRAASQKVASGLPFRNGGPGSENAYSAAYQRCVHLGLFQQIKAKYR